MSDIQVQGYNHPPAIEGLRALPLTAVVQVIVGAERWTERVPIGEFFRFARLIAVDKRQATDTTCPRCEEPASCDILVEWETGYISPDGDHVCEHCITGIVTEGVEKIGFGPDGAPWGNWCVSTVTWFDE